jgi:hypothetical protein
MAVHLFAKPLGDCTYRTRVLHVTVFGVAVRQDFFVRMDGIVMTKVVSKLFVKLREESARYEGRWSSVNARFALGDVRMHVRSTSRNDRLHAWPPEKPTAITPSSWPLLRNLGLTMEGVAIVRYRSSPTCRLCCYFGSRRCARPAGHEG